MRVRKTVVERFVRAWLASVSGIGTPPRHPDGLLPETCEGEVELAMVRLGYSGGDALHSAVRGGAMRRAGKREV